MRKVEREREIKRFAQQLVKAVDPSFRIAWRSARTRYTGYTWNGEDGVLHMSEIDTPLAIHDVAHVLLSSKKRLKQPDFGLGGDPTGFHDTEPDRTVSNEFAWVEEGRACDLHICLVLYSVGAKEADEVSYYLNVHEPPSFRAIKKFSKLPGMPPDFYRRVVNDLYQTRLYQNHKR